MKPIPHPLLRLSPMKRFSLCAGSLVLTFVLLTVIRTLDGRLQSPGAAWGMLSFQLARTPERSAEIIKSWDIAAQKSAESSLLLNFLFPLCYSTLLTIACLAAARLFRERGFQKTGWLATMIAWIQWPAAFCDLVENIALWVQLNGTIADPWPRIAFGCAVIKFLSVSAAIGILIAATLVWMLRRRVVRAVPPPAAV